jgi:hypothetical protein
MLGNPAENTDISGLDLNELAAADAEATKILGADMSGDGGVAEKITKAQSMTPSFGPPKLGGRSGR